MSSSLAGSQDRSRLLGEQQPLKSEYYPAASSSSQAAGSSRNKKPSALSGSTPRDGPTQTYLQQLLQQTEPGVNEHLVDDEGDHSDALSDTGDGAAAVGLGGGHDEERSAFISDGPPARPRQDDFHSTKSVWYLVLLTISIGGLQIAWSVELSNGSPYLLSLGLSKSLMALVWIAGPLTGTLVQPYIGMLSDNCRIPWGKRKPFMVAGAAGTIVSLMILSWSKEIVAAGLYPFGADPESQGVKVATIVFAVIWVYILDFAINTVQAAIRAFILDCAPPHQQEAANAMASRITGLGNIVGYIAGYINLPEIMGWLGNTQFKDLCFIASVSLGFTIVLSCLAIKERNPREDGGPPAKKRPGVFSFFVKIFTSIRRLPPQTKKVCTVQFCAWIGFFPMLFYTSSYIGEIYVEPRLEENPNMTPAELDRLYEEATRVGTFALLIFAITSLATNVFLPFLIAPTFDKHTVAVPEAPGEGPAAVINKNYDEDDEETKRRKSWLTYLIIPGLTLRRAWMYSQILFFMSMTLTVFARSVAFGTVLIGLVGITWALTLWAPWAIISAEISHRDAVARVRREQQRLQQWQQHQQNLQDRAVADLEWDAEHPERQRPSLDAFSDSDSIVVGGEDIASTDPAAAVTAAAIRADRVAENKELEEEEEDQAGVILGIHNMSIAAPQILATVGSSAIFKVLQKPRGTPGDHSIAVVLAIGGIAVLASAWFIHLIKDDETSPAVLPGEEFGDGAFGTDEEEGIIAAAMRSSRSSLESTDRLSRRSLDQAELVRNRSFGGAEY